MCFLISGEVMLYCTVTCICRNNVGRVQERSKLFKGKFARLKGLQRAQSLQFIRNKINSSVGLKWGKSAGYGGV